MRLFRIVVVLFCLSSASASTSGVVGKVLIAYPDRNSTKLVIETREQLVIGNNVFVGPSEAEATLGDLMSKTGEAHYYSASIPGKADVKQGDEVVTQKARRLETPSPLVLKFRESYTFENKRKGEVTAVQDGRAMIDRGTLHEVRERDLYRVYNASGAYRGLLEIKGIGDLQSSGVLYNRLEDRRRGALQTVPGDRVVFAGQRKLFALGVQGGIPLNPKKTIGTTETSNGGGLAWDIMFRDGWGFEMLFGVYGRSLTAQAPAPPCPCAGTEVQEAAEWSVSYIAPFLVKKNFAFPNIVSPYLGVGASLYKGRLVNRRTFHVPAVGARVTSWTDSDFTVVPILAAGIEAFPARFLRPRLEARWFGGSKLDAGTQTLSGEMLFLSLGVFTAW